MSLSRRLIWGEPGLHSVSMSLATRWGDGFGSASVSSIDPDEIQKALPSQDPTVVPGSTWCRGLGTQNLVPRIRGSRGEPLGLIYCDAKIRLQGSGKQS